MELERAGTSMQMRANPKPLGSPQPGQGDSIVRRQLGRAWGSSSASKHEALASRSMSLPESHFTNERSFFILIDAWAQPPLGVLRRRSPWRRWRDEEPPRLLH